MTIRSAVGLTALVASVFVPPSSGGVERPIDGLPDLVLWALVLWVGSGRKIFEGSTHPSGWHSSLKHSRFLTITLLRHRDDSLCGLLVQPGS